jgi:hypothetical protein
MLDSKENLALRIGAIMHNMESLCGPAVRETRSDEASNACKIATGFPDDVINHMAERWTSHPDSGGRLPPAADARLDAQAMPTDVQGP